MDTIELKVKHTYSKNWIWPNDGEEGIPHSTDIEPIELRYRYNLYLDSERQNLVNLLRIIDGDFNPLFGARDKNLRYEIIEIVFNNGTASGKITREVLDNKLGYQRFYPKSRD